MILSYKVRIHPSKTQIVQIEKMLRVCSVSYKATIRECEKALMNDENPTKIPSPDDIQKMLRSDPNLSLIMKADKHAMRDAIKDALKYAVKNMYRTEHDKPKKSESEIDSCIPGIVLESIPEEKYDIDRRLKTFRLDPPQSKKWIHKRHLRIRYLGKVKCKHTDRIPKSGKITGLLIKKEYDKYFCIVHVKNDIDSLLELGKRDGVPLNRMAISLSTDEHFLVFRNPKFGSKYVSFDDTYEKYQESISKIAHLEEVRTRALTTTGGLLSGHIEDLDYRIACETEHARNIMRFYIDKLVSSLTRMKVNAIIMESFTFNYFDSLSPKNDDYHQLIREREWKYFIKRLRSATYKKLIDIYVPVNTGAVHRICCECKRENKYVSAAAEMFTCAYCGKSTPKALNTATNLYECRELFDVNFDDISKLRKIYKNTGRLYCTHYE